jgi:hypothetical protein
MPFDWPAWERLTQKGRLIEHAEWTIDDDYLRLCDDPAAKLGDRVSLTPDEVRAAMDLATQTAVHLARELRERWHEATRLRAEGAGP